MYAQYFVWTTTANGMLMVQLPVVHAIDTHFHENDPLSDVLLLRARVAMHTRGHTITSALRWCVAPK